MMVTPCVGVWIETQYGSVAVLPSIVTPCVGVWIETTSQYSVAYDQLSHPAWVCGLKLMLLLVSLAPVVTPCVGVWIETNRFKALCRLTVSHPAWVCGLKRSKNPFISDCMCHTLRGCVD